MADLPPRYAFRVGHGERDAWDDDVEPSMPPREMDTRRWMIVAAAVGAGVLIAAVVSVILLGSGAHPFQGRSGPASPAEQAVAPGAVAPASGGAASSAPPPAGAATSGADARALAEARAGLAAMEAQLKSTTERADDLDRRLAAFEQTAAITTRRAEAAEASLVELQAERARVQRDLDAVNGELTQANADRAALRVQAQDAQAQAASSRAEAGNLAARVGSLTGEVGSLTAEAEQLRTCLAIHEEALYYTTLDNWGLLATATQGAAAACAAEVG